MVKWQGWTYVVQAGRLESKNLLSKRYLRSNLLTNCQLEWDFSGSGVIGLYEIVWINHTTVGLTIFWVLNWIHSKSKADISKCSSNLLDGPQSFLMLCSFLGQEKKNQSKLWREEIGLGFIERSISALVNVVTPLFTVLWY